MCSEFQINLNSGRKDLDSYHNLKLTKKRIKKWKMLPPYRFNKPNKGCKNKNTQYK